MSPGDGWDSFNEDGPLRFTYLNALFTVGRTVWEELGGMALLDGACY